MAKKGLGRGLTALLGTDVPAEKSSSQLISPVTPDTEQLPMSELSVTSIEPNRKQPRKQFDKEKIDALAESIREVGLIQPIVVKSADNGMYTIIAGERRWRAAKKAGLKKVPVIIKEYSEIEIAEIALIENLQREDLNPIEEAAGYRALIEEFSLTQDEVSKKMGKSRSAIANSLRLLTLGENISKLLIDGLLSAGHARALLSLEDESLREEAAQIIINDGLNVRQAEQLVKKITKPHKTKPQLSEEFKIELDSISGKLCDRFGTKVNISHGDKKGKIEIEYYGNDDLDRILNLLNI